VAVVAHVRACTSCACLQLVIDEDLRLLADGAASRESFWPSTCADPSSKDQILQTITDLMQDSAAGQEPDSAAHCRHHPRCEKSYEEALKITSGLPQGTPDLVSQRLTGPQYHAGRRGAVSTDNVVSLILAREVRNLQ